MVHLDSGVGHERYLFLEALLLLCQQVARVGVVCERRLLLRLLVAVGCTLLFCFSLALLLRLLAFLLLCLLRLAAVCGRVVFLETVVGLLQERHMVVEFLHVELSVDVYLAVVGDGVAKRSAVFEVRTAHPVVRSVVRSVGCYPVEHRNEINRQLVRRLERLVVLQRSAQMLDGCPHRVLPSRVAIGIEILVYGCVRLLNLCVRGALEVHVQVLREVPAQVELAVPQEL